MSLPVNLKVGMISIYGQGSTQALFDVERNSSIVFGTVNSMNSQYGSVSVGQSVMYSKDDVMAAIFYSDYTYYILPESKVIFIENESPPAP